MWRALFRKELHDARPFIGLGLFFIAIEVLDGLLAYPDARPLALTWPAVAQGPAPLVHFLIAFAMGAGLWRREHEEGTLDFLDGLPLSRRQVFAGKLAVAVPVLMIYPLGEVTWALVCHAASRDSMSSGLHLPLLGTLVALNVLHVLLGVSVGVLLAFLGRLNWLALGVLAATLLALEERVRWVRWLDPGYLSGQEVVGGALSIQWPALALQLGVCVTALALSLLLFTREPSPRQQERRRPVVGVALGLATAVAGAVAFVLAVGGFEDSEQEGDVWEGARFEEPVVVRARTQHYDVSYPASQTRIAQALLARADSIFETVRDFLDAPGGEVGLDLFGSMAHTLGTAFWSRVRMELSGDGKQDEATLAHETAHVFVARLAREGQGAVLGQLHVFNEGLAHYVELRFVSPERWANAELMAAVARARHQVSEEVLVDPERLEREHDVMLQYALGALFTRALVEAHGDEAVSRVLIAAARADAPKELSNLARWQDAFQAAGYDFTSVVHRFFTLLDELVESRRAQVEALPRLKGALEEGLEEVGIRPLHEGELPEGWEPVIRFRPDEDSDFRQVLAPPARGGVFWYPRSRLAGAQLHYQLGLAGPDDMAVYEDWSSVRVR